MCGLFGFIGFEKQKVDIRSFLALGVENDSRGGHGCGIFVDGQVEYGAASEKYFEKFYDQSQLLPKIKTAEVLIGHDRKASVGGICDEKLQPVVITNEETGQIDFVLMHNGTIVNHTELAQKYLNMDKTESDKLSDSQIMARIIYTHGFGVFAEYVGAGVFVMVDYRTPKRKPSVFVFKGFSKEYSYSTKATEERPLYYIRTPKGLWFSSMSNHLNIMRFGTDSPVYQFPYNIVMLINKDATLRIVEKIDRESMTQKQTVQTTVYTHNPNVYPYYNADYYDDYYLNEFGYESSRANLCVLGADSTPKENNTEIIMQNAQCIENMIEKGQMICNDYFQYIDAQSRVPLTGTYYVDKFGKFTTDYNVKFPYKLYLFNGVPVFGETILDTIIDYCRTQTECVDFDEMCAYFPEIVYPFTSWPRYDINKDPHYLRFTKEGKTLPFTGHVVVPFGKIQDTVYTFIDGILTHKEATGKNTAKFYKKYKAYCHRDYEHILRFLTV